MASGAPPISPHVIEGIDHLKVRVGTFERHIWATTEPLERFERGRFFQRLGKETRRTVEIGTCQVIEGELDGQKFYDKPVTIFIYETDQEQPSPLGAVALRDGLPWINLWLPPDLFAQI